MSTKNRLEAFSDGVMAIAITLLVLDLAVPSRQALALDHQTLWSALRHQWPNYAAYVVSFLVIGIIWVNHHSLFALIERVDRLTLFTNLILLLVVSAIPFPTRLMAEYLTADDASAHTAAAVYSLTMLAMSIAFTALFVAGTRSRMVKADVDPAVVRRQLPRFAIGGAVYAALVGVAFISAPLTLLGHFALALYYVFDQVGSTEPADPRPERR